MNVNNILEIIERWCCSNVHNNIRNLDHKKQAEIYSREEFEEISPKMEGMNVMMFFSYSNFNEKQKMFFNKHAKHRKNVWIIPLRLMSKQEILCALTAKWCYEVNKSPYSAIYLFPMKLYFYIVAIIGKTAE